MFKVGLQVLLEEHLALLAGQRVGLATHAAAVLPNLTGAAAALLQAGVQLTALFGPEHGVQSAGADGALLNHAVDARTGLPVYSLYGATKEPTPEMLREVDVLLFDMQDVGVRFYTYLSTLYYVLRGAAAAGVPVIVLDRPNPLGGDVLEGPTVAPGYASFVGITPVSLRHGMTLGELAGWLNTEASIGAVVRVIPMDGWRREMRFAGTGLPWVPTSPALAHLAAVDLYPGLCLFEGTNLSEGRGTAQPFEVFGAPWLDGERCADYLNALALPGVRFRATAFMPGAGKHAQQVCSGVQVHVKDARVLAPVACGLHCVAACLALAPARFAFLETSWEGHPPHFDLLLGSDRERQGLLAQRPVAALLAEWAQECADFAQRRRPYLLYQ